MDGFIEFLRGPGFRFAMAVAVVGLTAQVMQSIVGLVRARMRAGDKRLDVAGTLKRTILWLMPLRHFVGSRPFYSVFSVLFHAGILIVPFWYLGHIRLWGRGMDVAWPAIPGEWADGLTLMTLGAGVALLLGRLFNRVSRQTSRLQDWVLPSLLVVAFGSGYWMAHPGTSPFSPSATALAHVLSGDVLLVIAPFTKIVHCVMLPFSRFAAEWTWRLVPNAGADAQRTLGKALGKEVV